MSGTPAAEHIGKESKPNLLQFRSRLADGATEKQPGEQATSVL